MKNTKRLIAMSMAAAMFSTTPALAGTWQGAEGSYRYQNDDGSFAAGGWHWIDGNNDGTAESYYFDPNGILLQNTTTPDNYQVDASGAWVVDGVVQTKSVGAAQAAGAEVNEGAPLAHLKDYFVNSPMFGLTWKWDLDYIWEQNPEADNKSNRNEQYQHTGTREIQMQEALAMNNSLPLSGFTPRSTIAVAELAGVPATGYESLSNETRMRIDALKNEIVAFLNSFDWRNASDFEKAVRISERVARAEYHDDTTYSVNDFGQTVSDWGDASTEFGCLIDGKCNCDGYVTAATLLATCVGLQNGTVVSGNHAYPVYFINGVWVRHEPTSKDRFFRVFDYMKDGGVYGSNNEYYMPIAEFMERSGYKTPTNEEVLAAFPGKARVFGDKVTIYFD